VPPRPKGSGQGNTQNKVAGESRTDGKRYLALYEWFGVVFSSDGSGDAHAEECPFCERDRFYVNPATGTYKCHSGSCDEQGNAYTFIQWVHRSRLEDTSDDHYRLLKDKRGLPLQTLKRHELAWDEASECWLIPFKSVEGKVQNLCRYFMEDGRKLSLPALPVRLYGLDTLKQQVNPGRVLFLCEGPFDAIALDHHLVSNKTRDRYDILAVPSANVFKPEWLRYLEGRTVRLCFDNDKAGRGGQDRIVRLVRNEKLDCKLLALSWPPEFPEKYDVSNLIRDGRDVVKFTRGYCLPVASPERRIVFVSADKIPDERIAWMWAGHIPFATFASLSGTMGTQKSAITRDIVARATAGLPMPQCKDAVAAFNVLYFTSEDPPARVRDLVRIHGGDLSRLVVHDIASGPEPVDVLEHLEEIENEINARGVRLVVLDALNSFVGGDISTDSKARRTLSGRLMALARRTGACIIGIRNWGRIETGSGSQRALGAVSLSDVARCVMNTREFLPPEADGLRRFELEFEKVSDAPKPPSVGYVVINKSTCQADSYMRQVAWAPSPSEAMAVKTYFGQEAPGRSEKR
jgi:hypothetical protein